VLFVLAVLFVWRFMIQMPGQSYEGALPEPGEPQLTRAEQLRRDVEYLAVTIGERNIGCYPQLVRTAAFIENELTEVGYEVARQEYEVWGVKCDNLEVEIAGSTRADEIVIVGGHYDTVPGSPGANDNGSGVAATLALARAFAGSSPERTLRFVAFVNEEPPYFQSEEMGSLVYARRSRERDENVVAMLSMETIGYFSDEPGSQQYPPGFRLFYPSQGNFIGVVGNFGSRKLVRQAVKIFRANADFPCEGGALPGLIVGVGWSDHWSFWQEGYQAVMITDTAPFRYPHYHQASDTPDKLDFDRMARVVDGMEKVVQTLASPGAAEGAPSEAD